MTPAWPRPASASRTSCTEPRRADDREVTVDERDLAPHQGEDLAQLVEGRPAAHAEGPHAHDDVSAVRVGGDGRVQVPAALTHDLLPGELEVGGVESRSAREDRVDAERLAAAVTAAHGDELPVDERRPRGEEEAQGARDTGSVRSDAVREQDAVGGHAAAHLLGDRRVGEGGGE